jgi:hypothetical protein
MAQKQNGKIFGLLAALVAVFAVVMFGLNFVTGPLIAKNGNAQELAPLYAVMSDASGFEKLYDVADAASSALVNVPETVQSIYAETSGKGYVVRMATTKGYTGNAIELTMAVDSEGKISGMTLDAYPESKDFGAEYPQTFVGQDSALSDIVIVAGCTYSSVAFRDAVSDGFAALIANELVGAGQKGADQILMELLGTAHSGLVNNVGVGQFEEADGTGNIVKIMKARNNSGYAYLMKNGDSMVLAVVNTTGAVKVIDVEGKDVTDACAALAGEAVAHAATGTPVSTDKEKARLNALLPDAEQKVLPLDGVFNSVTAAYELTKGGETYYGLVARSYGYDNEVMGVYYVLDAQGAIVGMTVDELIFHAEYFHTYTLDEPSYKAGFAGLTAGSWTGEQALIAGATMTTDAMKTATNDIFAAYEILKGGAA